MSLADLYRKLGDWAEVRDRVMAENLLQTRALNTCRRLARMPMQDRFQHLLNVISGQRFLLKQGLGNEVPFFTCPFRPEEAAEMESFQCQLSRRLAQMGIRVLEINLCGAGGANPDPPTDPAGIRAPAPVLTSHRAVKTAAVMETARLEKFAQFARRGLMEQAIGISFILRQNHDPELSQPGSLRMNVCLRPSIDLIGSW